MGSQSSRQLAKRMEREKERSSITEEKEEEAKVGKTSGKMSENILKETIVSSIRSGFCFTARKIVSLKNPLNGFSRNALRN
jgi:hypothetical protein